jgi:Icc-related predicted phosphoesterase
LKFVVVSDTHGQHNALSLPEADGIIHAGDVSGAGHASEVMDFLKWFSGLSYTYKIFIAGNHDFFFEDMPADTVSYFIPPDIIYLNDSGINIEGIEIWGSPVTPWFNNWAFNRVRGAPIKAHWDKIPVNTQILITHGPAWQRFDKTTSKIHVGCKDLLNRIKEIKPAFHIFGHIHETYGRLEKDGCTYINASVLDERYKLKNPPFIIEI